MIDELSQSAARFLASRDGCEEDRARLYQVGFDVIFSTLVTIMGIGALACWLDNLAGAVLFLLCFMTVRSYSGGYHAKTRVRCFILTCSAYLLTAILARSIYPDNYFSAVAAASCVDFLVLWLFAPIENKNKRLPLDWKIRNKRKAWISEILWKLIAVCIYPLDVVLSFQIFMTETVITILILWCKPWRRMQ